MNAHRLRSRKLRIWQRDYLISRHLWSNIEWAVGKALSETSEADPVVVDIGCGNCPYRELFETSKYIGIDPSTSDAAPDFVADAASVPFQSGSVDIVFSTQVVEHVPHPHKMLEECARVLKQGGHLILTGPFYWPLHEEPRDFYRFTKYGFSQLLSDAGFSEWEIREDGGDWAQLLVSINLRLRSDFLIPICCIVNMMGMILETIGDSKHSPANYTIFARR